MVNNTITSQFRLLIISGLLIFSLSLGTPLKVKLGVRGTHYEVLEGDYLPGRFNLDIHAEPYFGLSGEMLISPIKNLSLRLELAQVRFYTRRQLGGGQSIHLFNGLDADVLYELPFGKKVSPLIYGGINYEKYFNKPIEDWRAFDAAYDARIGTGAVWRLKDKLEIAGEIQLLNWYMLHRHAIYFDSPESIGWFIFGFPKVNLGLRYTL